MTRLSTERLDELYLGTLRLVARDGFDKITMDQIAEATHSSKATLYRQWGSKAGLVATALNCVTATPDDPPDTGSLRGDLIGMLAGRHQALEQEADLVGSILHAVKTDATLRTALRDQIISTLHGRLAAVVERAVDRGEVATANPALRHIDLVLIAPFVLRLLIDDRPVDDDYLIDYLDAVLLPALGVVPR
ncbi:TetR/AcrR family transcriptional regulator [Nocardioides sp.]|uniref:TetR/AcrR family transcriptional regulator n=1 Tax=Nocardioides sp. TaxID=35761 RepID=UPI003D09BCDA